MAITTNKKSTGKCPVSNNLSTIDVSYLQSPVLEGIAYQKQSFSCNNQKCEYYLNQTCPIFKNIPFTSVE